MLAVSNVNGYVEPSGINKQYAISNDGQRISLDDARSLGYQLRDACDLCRGRKLRCSGISPDESPCARCKADHSECVFCTYLHCLHQPHEVELADHESALSPPMSPPLTPLLQQKVQRSRKSTIVVLAR